MATFAIVSAVFFMMSLLFGLRFAEIVLKLAVSSVLGGVVWFLYGLTTGDSVLFAWLGGTIVALVLIELMFGRD